MFGALSIALTHMRALTRSPTSRPLPRACAEPGQTPVRGRPLVASVAYAGTSAAYIDGVLEAQSVQSFKAAFSFTLCVGSRANEGGDRYFDGEVGEVLVYNGQLPEAQHAAAVAYLMAKWGIA